MTAPNAIGALCTRSTSVHCTTSSNTADMSGCKTGPCQWLGDVTLLVRRTTAPLHSLHLPLLLPPPAQLCLLCSTYKGPIKSLPPCPFPWKGRVQFSACPDHTMPISVVSDATHHQHDEERGISSVPVFEHQPPVEPWYGVWSCGVPLISPACVWCVPGAWLDTRHTAHTPVSCVTRTSESFPLIL